MVKIGWKAGTDGLDHVELRSSVVVARSWKHAQQGLIQRDHNHIDEEDFAELVEPSLETIFLVFEVLKHFLEDLSKERTEAFCEPPVERA